MTVITMPLKWHGGKGPLAKRIVALMPRRCKTPNAPKSSDPGWLHYVEPYFGGGSVLLANNPKGISEVVNDRNKQLMNFWQVLQRTWMFDEFKRRVEAIPFSQFEYEITRILNWPDVEPAVRFFVGCRQSMSGRMDSFAPLSRNRTRRGMNEQASAWLTAIKGLPAVHARLKRVVMLNDDAIAVIKQQDGARTLFYLDPPYLHETRATTTEYGRDEMQDKAHAILLDTLKRIKGRFMLSGYHSKMYDQAATKGRWRLKEFKVPNNAASGAKKRRMTECVWMNF